MTTDEAVEKALETLTGMLESESPGVQLEAAREILKYSAAMN